MRITGSSPLRAASYADPLLMPKNSADSSTVTVGLVAGSSVTSRSFLMLHRKGLRSIFSLQPDTRPEPM